MCSRNQQENNKLFNYEKGVQQGSPLLFNLYISDIFELLKNDSALTLNGQEYFNALMYADDMVIMSATEEGLQKSLTALNDYCKKWKFNVNHKKTKCMIFSKASKTKNIDFTINSRIIENTKEFKYLGISINSKDCTFKPTLSDLSSRRGAVVKRVEHISTIVLVNMSGAGSNPAGSVGPI